MLAEASIDMLAFCFKITYLSFMENESLWSNSAIGEAFSSANFVLKTQRQIAKDFGNHGFEFEPDFETGAYEIQRLQDAIQLMLSEIVEKHPSKWLPLMYSLDISEKNYVKFFQQAQSGWLAEFALVVIRREAQKVFFREKLK